MTRRILLFCLSFLLFLSTAHVFAEDSREGRALAAERYLNAVPISQLLEDTFREMSKSLPEALREGFVKQMRMVVRADLLEEATRASLIRHFTVDELNAMAEFYSSPHGASAMRKFGAYMADVLSLIHISEPTRRTPISYAVFCAAPVSYTHLTLPTIYSV